MFLCAYLNLVIPERFKWQKPWVKHWIRMYSFSRWNDKPTFSWTPLLNLIGSEVSVPFLVTTNTLVFQLLQSLAMTLHNQTGDLCNNITPFDQPWPTELYAFLTSIHAILRLRLSLWQSKVTVRSMTSINRLGRFIREKIRRELSV